MSSIISPPSSAPALGVTRPALVGPGQPKARRRAIELLIFVALALAPLASSAGLSVTMLAEAMIFAIAAMSLDLILGYTGLASFGHAAFFGLGAYAAGLVGVHFSALLPVTLGAAVLVGAIGAFIGGILAIRATGIYFIFLTLALAQLVYAIAFKWRWLTGGDDGLADVPRPSLAMLDRFIDMSNNSTFYLLTLVIFAGAYLLLRRTTDSAFGKVLVGVKGNDTRMAALGYSVPAYKVAAFTIAGAFAGLAGGLFAHLFQLVSPDQLGWQASAMLLVMVVLGGSGSLVGPIIGALVIVLMQNVLSTYTDRWPSVMALCFIGVVMYARGGIWGLLKRLLGGRRPSESSPAGSAKSQGTHP